MALYHLILDANQYYEQLTPALTACWQRRSFAPAGQLARNLSATAQVFADQFHTNPAETLLARVAASELSFDRHLWRSFVGEVLWFAATEIPELQTQPETLTCLLAPGHTADAPRGQWALIQQAHFGSRDLVFGGGIYRPDAAGWNDPADVARLAAYLADVDPQSWSPAALTTLAELADDDERAEELELAREWFPALRDLYSRAHDQGQVVVCEIM